MADDCCRLVGDLVLNIDGCIISINSSTRPEIIKECGTDILVGPTMGTISITGYAVTPTENDSGLHTGCAGKAGVTIPWVRRYDCDLNTVYFISAGQGASYVSGPVETLATLNNTTGRKYPTINASAGSGPATVYMLSEQEDGYGLNYTGGPIDFNTTESLQFANFVEEGGPILYLQNFSLEMTPGEIPVASYSFTFAVTD
jgi:hypothetical protein